MPPACDIVAFFHGAFGLNRGQMKGSSERASGFQSLGERIFVFYTPPAPPSPAAGAMLNDDGIALDVVFLHGMRSDEFKCWEYGDQRALWPVDFLSKDLPRCRLLSVGYDTSASTWGTGSPTFSIETRARVLLDRLLQPSVDLGARPLVFVAHSLGGIIVKSVITLLRLSMEKEAARLLDCVVGTAFYATPHRGCAIGAAAAIADSILGSAVRVSPQLRELRPNSEYLLSLNANFLSIAEKKGIKILSFGEGKKTGMVLIVSEWSANPAPGIHPFHVLDANHQDINVPSSRHSDCYQLLLKFLQKIYVEVDEAALSLRCSYANAATAVVGVRRSCEHVLGEFIGLHDPSLNTTVKKRASHSPLHDEQLILHRMIERCVALAERFPVVTETLSDLRCALRRAGDCVRSSGGGIVCGTALFSSVREVADMVQAQLSALHEEGLLPGGCVVSAGRSRAFLELTRHINALIGPGPSAEKSCMNMGRLTLQQSEAIVELFAPQLTLEPSEVVNSAGEVAADDPVGHFHFGLIANHVLRNSVLAEKFFRRAAHLSQLGDDNSVGCACTPSGLLIHPCALAECCILEGNGGDNGDPTAEEIHLDASLALKRCAERHDVSAAGLNRSAEIVLFSSAVLLLRKKKFDDAIQLLKSSQVISLTSSFTLLGLCSLRARKWIDAENYLRIAASRANSDEVSHSNLAFLHYRLGQLDLAAAECRQVLDFHPNSVLALTTLGWIELRGCIRELSRGSLLQRVDVGFQPTPAVAPDASPLEKKLDTVAHAKLRFERVVKTDAGVLLPGQSTRSWAICGLGRIAEIFELNAEVAEKFYRRAFQGNPRCSWAAQYLGDLCARRRDTAAECVRWYEASLAADSANDWSLTSLAVQRLIVCRGETSVQALDSAEENLTKALHIDKTNIYALTALSHFYRVRRPDTAKLTYVSALLQSAVRSFFRPPP